MAKRVVCRHSESIDSATSIGTCRACGQQIPSQEVTRGEKAFAFLAILFASLPDMFYTADAGQWATAISDLRNKYEAKYPNLFRHLHFRHVPRGDSYSPEVSNFLAFLQFTDATVVHNPGFTKMQLQQTARQLLEDRYKEFFNSQELSVVKQMSQEIADRLKKT